jgi:hypothetical protein
MTMPSNELSPEEIRLAANWSWHRLTGLSFGGNPAAPAARAIYRKAQARDRVARAEIRRNAEIEGGVLSMVQNGPVGEIDIARRFGITPIEAARVLEAMMEGRRLAHRQRKPALSAARLAMGTPPLLDALALKKRDDHSKKLAKRAGRATHQKTIASAEDYLLAENLRRDILKEIAQACIAEAHEEGALVTKPNDAVDVLVDDQPLEISEDNPSPLCDAKGVGVKALTRSKLKAIYAFLRRGDRPKGKHKTSFPKPKSSVSRMDEFAYRVQLEVLPDRRDRHNAEVAKRRTAKADRGNVIKINGALPREVVVISKLQPQTREFETGFDAGRIRHLLLDLENNRHTWLAEGREIQRLLNSPGKRPPDIDNELCEASSSDIRHSCE